MDKHPSIYHDFYYLFVEKHLKHFQKSLLNSNFVVSSIDPHFWNKMIKVKIDKNPSQRNWLFNRRKCKIKINDKIEWNEEHIKSET